MSVALNDVNIISVETADRDFRAGIDPIQVIVRAEAGADLFSTGGSFQVRMTVTDTTDPALLQTQTCIGDFGTPQWPLPPGPRSFTFTVPPAVTTGRAWSIIELQARVVASTADASHAVGERILLTP